MCTDVADPMFQFLQGSYTKSFMATNKQLPPELFVQVATKLTDRSDVSRFSRCSRACYDLITPLLFRHIKLFEADISAIADAFKRRPFLAALCQSLTLGTANPVECDDDEYDDSSGSTWYYKKVTYPPLPAEDVQNVLCEDFATVFEMLGKEGNIKTFVFPSKDIITFLTRAWRALGGLSALLVELDLGITQSDYDFWATFFTSTTTFSQLRVLRLYMDEAHGWNCAPLQKMLNGLKDLETLHVSLPVCCGPVGLDLSSTHPHLHTFSMTAENLPGSFLRRHPTIERLSLRDINSLKLHRGDLPHLKSLIVSEDAISKTSVLARSPLTNLCLYDMPHLSSSEVQKLIKPIAGTLRYLDFQWQIHSFRASIPYFGKLLRRMPGLQQLSITIPSICVYSRDRIVPLNVDDLSQFLLSIAKCKSLINLRLSDYDGSDLPRSRLDNMGVLPQSLRYLCWDVRNHATMYHVDNCQGKMVAITTDVGNVFPGDVRFEEFHTWAPM